MGECEYTDNCAFFLDESVEKDPLKEKYCHGSNLNCGRFMIAMSIGMERVPNDLSPDDKQAAYKVIAENS